MQFKQKTLMKFWSKINKTEYCWECTDFLNSYGYSCVQYRVDGVKKKISSHRFSWIIHNGEIPDGLFVCHKCDNPKCVNPDHLFLGTHQDNMDDMKSKGRGNYTFTDATKQLEAITKAKSPEAIAKKKATFNKIGHNKGDKNYQFGRMWITNGVASRTIMKESVIPDGWYKGRKM